MKVHELLHHTAQQIPGNIAVFDDQGTLTYLALSKAVHDMSIQLRNHGIFPGMGVGVMGMNSRQFIIMAFAVMETGAVVMPLSSQLSANEIKDVIQTAGLHAIIDDKIRDAPFQGAIVVEFVLQNKPWRLTFNHSIRDSNQFAPHVEDAALIRFTSGTTGTSKGVILSHKTIEERISAANRVLQLGHGDRVLWVLSMAYHFVVSIILYLRYGSGIIVCNDILSASILSLITKHGATFIYAAPIHIRLLANDTSGIKMESVKKVISTSTSISKIQCDTFYNRYQVPVSQAYGIIEIGLPIINLMKSDKAPDAIGYAVPGYEVEILDDDFKPLPPGETGHLAIRGPGMLNAYLFPPRKRDEILDHGWFMTGDLASKNEDGLIKVEGRKKSMINVAGNKVFPEEVEAVLNQHPSIQLSRISGYLHSLTGEMVQAELLLQPGKEIPDVEELRIFCRQQLSPHKVPQKFIFVNKLPMTDSGKLIR